MRRVYVFLAFSIVPALARAQVAQVDQADAGPPRIVAAVTRTARVAPDRATLYAAIEASAEAAGDAVQRAERKAQAVADAVRQAGAAAENVSVVPYGVSQPVTVGGYQGSTQQPPFVGRFAVRVAAVRADQVGTFAAAMVTAGAMGAASAVFEATAADSVRRVLASQAIAEAEREAQALVAALGGRLGPLVDATSNPGPNTAGYGNFGVGVGFSSPYVNVNNLSQPPDVLVTASVTVRYRFVPR